MKGPHCLLVFEETCQDWMTAALGAMSQVIRTGVNARVYMNAY